LPPATGVAVADKITEPLCEGFQLQEVVNTEPEPVATLFLHPEMIVFPCLKVTLADVSTLALIVTAVRNVAEVAFPAKANELKLAVIAGEAYLTNVEL
jgi:hypothetical protein